MKSFYINLYIAVFGITGTIEILKAALNKTADADNYFDLAKGVTLCGMGVLVMSSTIRLIEYDNI